MQETVSALAIRNMIRKHYSKDGMNDSGNVYRLSKDLKVVVHWLRRIGTKWNLVWLKFGFFLIFWCKKNGIWTNFIFGISPPAFVGNARETIFAESHNSRHRFQQQVSRVEKSWSSIYKHKTNLQGASRFLILCLLF